MKRWLCALGIVLAVSAFSMPAFAEDADGTEPFFDSEIMPIGQTSPNYWTETDIGNVTYALQLMSSYTARLQTTLSYLYLDRLGREQTWTSNSGLADVLAGGMSTLTYIVHSMNGSLTNISNYLHLNPAQSFYDPNPNAGSATYTWAANVSPSQAIYTVGSTITGWYYWKLLPALNNINTNTVNQTSSILSAIQSQTSSLRRSNQYDVIVHGGFLEDMFMVYRSDTKSFIYYNSSANEFFPSSAIPSGSFLDVLFVTAGSNHGGAVYAPLSGTLSLYADQALFQSVHLDVGDIWRIRLVRDFSPTVSFQNFRLYWVPDADAAATSAFGSLNHSTGSKLQQASSGIAEADTAISQTESQYTQTATSAIGSLDFGNNGTALYAAGLDFVGDTFMMVWNGSPALSGVITVSLMLGVMLLILGRGSRLFPHDGGDG